MNEEEVVQKLALQIAQLSYEKAHALTRAEHAEEQVRQLKAQQGTQEVSRDGTGTTETT